MRFFLTFQALILAMLFSGCATTGPYVEKESDKLTDKEKFHLFDYSRHFIINTIITKPAKKEAEDNNPCSFGLCDLPLAYAREDP